MPLVSDRCICLRKTEFSETSQILTLFSRTFGVVRLMAKGAHRRTKAGSSKFDGGIDFLDLGQAVFSHDPARNLRQFGCIVQRVIGRRQVPQRYPVVGFPNER